MATSVNAAFNEFLQDTVNLDPSVTKTARGSRDWLYQQIHDFPTHHDPFPRLYSEKDIAFGSFARRTKIRELDDVDLIAAIAADGAYYTEYASRVEITVPDNLSTPLLNYLHDGTRLLNSRRIINAFVAAAKTVPQYAHADIKRTGEAATLSLTSYPWTFDIVPAFFTVPDPSGRTYYVIPDGDGHWKKTDPRRDRDTVSALNQRHGGNMLNAIRVMKYWNGRRTAPAVPSYLFETMLVHYYATYASSASEFVDLEIPRLLAHVSSAIWGAVMDLKGIQGDINTMTVSEREQISARAAADAQMALEARELEDDGDHRGSINRWRAVFGDAFPTYG